MAVFGICLRRQMKMGDGTQYECTCTPCYQLFYRAQLWNGKIANKIKWKALFACSACNIHWFRWLSIKYRYRYPDSIECECGWIFCVYTIRSFFNHLVATYTMPVSASRLSESTQSRNVAHCNYFLTLKCCYYCMAIPLEERVRQVWHFIIVVIYILSYGLQFICVCADVLFVSFRFNTDWNR